MSLQMLSEELAGLNLEGFMRLALQEAEQAGKAGEYPIGAVLVVEGEVVSTGYAQHRSRRSQLAHAEMNALIKGGEPLWLHYNQAVLFTTVEPCPMCLGAAVMADVPHIIYAVPDRNVDGDKLVQVPYIRRHLRSYWGGVLKAEAQDLIRRYDPKILDYISR